MKLSEFILMNEEEKMSAVLHQGVLIGKRNSLDCKVFLFQLESYYVETFCNTGSRAVEEFRVFDSISNLHPYLESISLDELLN